MMTSGSPIDDERQRHMTEFEGILGVNFNNQELLQRALTHRSFVNEIEVKERDNERLEFLGDAILDFVVGDMLFRRFPDVTEGELTQLRAALVRTDSLAMLAADCHLGDYLRIGKGEENSGGRSRVNLLCRGFEALIGAMYMDQGLQRVKEFAVPRLSVLLDYVLKHNLHLDARSILQELSQADLHITPVYRVVDIIGPDHEKEYLIEVMIGQVSIAQGTGPNKRSAAQSAARTALELVETQGWPAEALDQEPTQHDERPKRESQSDSSNDDDSALATIYDVERLPLHPAEADQAVTAQATNSDTTGGLEDANKSLVRSVAAGKRLDIPRERKPRPKKQADARSDSKPDKPKRKRRRRKSRAERRREQAAQQQQPSQHRNDNAQG